MKFSLFIHMERVTPDEEEKRLYEEMIELCRIADEGGMHAIWTGEHHGMNFTIAPNPLLNLVDLARRTKNVRLGTGTVIAPFWHPIKLAGEAAMTDIISDGRLDIGIARHEAQLQFGATGARLAVGHAAHPGARIQHRNGLVAVGQQGNLRHQGMHPGHLPQHARFIEHG